MDIYDEVKTVVLPKLTKVGSNLENKLIKIPNTIDTIMLKC